MSVLSQFTGFPLFDGDRGNITVSASGQTWTIDNGVVTNAMLQNSTISGVALGSNLNSITFNNGGAGGGSGSTFNGGSALTVSYNTVGAPSTTGTNASGTWGINITGDAASVDGKSFGTFTAAGGVVYATSTTAASATAAGTAGQFLRSNAASAPTWETLQMSDIPDAAFKRSVKAATTADLGTVTYANGTAGVGATITGPTGASAVVFPAQDGVTLALNERLLVKNQTAALQNGIYTLTTVGVAGTTAWVLTRATDADTSSELGAAVVGVDAGTANGGELWTTTFRTTDTIGSTAIAWYEVIYNNGSWGISITGSSASCTGNAATATTLQTARTINGTSFNGSANITITANTPNSITFNNGGAGGASGSTFNGGGALTVSYNTVGAPSTTGTGASGSWGINITGSSASCTGNAATASQATIASTVAVGASATATAFKVPFLNTTSNISVVTDILMDSESTFTYDPSTNTLTLANLSSTGSITSSGNITAYSSDGRLKENLKHLENPIEKIQSLNGYTFDWNEKSKELGFVPKHEKGDIGLIAQEVESVLPQAVAPAPFDHKRVEEGLVSKSGENYLTIQYERLVPLLVEAIKEQQNQINQLKAQIEGMK